MGTYHQISEGDVLHSVIHTAPKLIFASGGAGWRSNVGTSSSLSLYGGIRSRTNVRSADFSTSGLAIYPLDELPTHSIDKVVFVSGSYPATASVHFAKVRNSSLDSVVGGYLTHVTPDDWYDEHFSPIELLYDYYSSVDAGYFLGSYDYRALYLKQSISKLAPCVYFSGSILSQLTGTFSMEMRVKPTTVTGSNDFTLMSQRSRWKLYITGSVGSVCFSDFSTILSSSVFLSPGNWSSVAFVADGTRGNFYLDGDIVSSIPYTGSLTASTASLVVGAEKYLSGSVPVLDRGFNGFIFESRVWSVARNAQQISDNSLRALPSYNETGLVHYARFNDGPLSNLHGYTTGSGSYDYSPSKVHGVMQNVNSVLPACPVWQPNDDSEFVTQKVKDPFDPSMLRVLHVPSIFYGRQIATGSVRLTCNAYNNQGIVRTLVDDHRGNLYVSGSLTRAIGGDDRLGVSWNKVGNVFYTEGLVVITDQSLLDFGGYNLDSSLPNDTLQIELTGQHRIPTKTFMCRLGAGQANVSNNPTYTKVDPDDQLRERRVISRPTPITYVTAIGLYDDDRNLVAVAKLAQPIRKREQDKENIKLRFDF